MEESHRPSKRPSSGKTVSYFLEIPDKEQGENFGRIQEQNFAKLRNIYEHILTPAEKKPINEYKNELQATIDILQSMKALLVEGYTRFEENTTKVVPTVPVRQKAAPKREIIRSMSQKISYNPNTNQKPQKKHKRASITTETGSKQLNCNTIWNQVNRFFGTVPTVTNLAKYLYQIDVTPSRGQIGQHYSIAYNEKLKQKYKNDSVQIRIPGTISSTTTSNVSSPDVVFQRLLCSFVHLSKERSIERNNKITDTPTIDHNVDALHPNAYGTSIYTSIPFEQKLILEVQSLGLHPGKSAINTVDNQIAREMDMAHEEYINSLKKTNQMRAVIMDKLKKMEPILTAKAFKLRRAMPQPERPETPKKPPRPKSRDKSVDD